MKKRGEENFTFFKHLTTRRRRRRRDTQSEVHNVFFKVSFVLLFKAFIYSVFPTTTV